MIQVMTSSRRLTSSSKTTCWQHQNGRRQSLIPRNSTPDFSPLGALEARLGYTFRDRRPARNRAHHPSYAAITHTSTISAWSFWASAVRSRRSAATVIGAAAPFGEGSFPRVALVSRAEEALCESPAGLTWGRWFSLSVGEERGGGRTSPTILADVMRPSSRRSTWTAARRSVFAGPARAGRTARRRRSRRAGRQRHGCRKCCRPAAARRRCTNSPGRTPAPPAGVPHAGHAGRPGAGLRHRAPPSGRRSSTPPAAALKKLPKDGAGAYRPKRGVRAPRRSVALAADKNWKSRGSSPLRTGRR